MGRHRGKGGKPAASEAAAAEPDTDATIAQLEAALAASANVSKALVAKWVQGTSLSDAAANALAVSKPPAGPPAAAAASYGCFRSLGSLHGARRLTMRSLAVSPLCDGQARRLGAHGAGQDECERADDAAGPAAAAQTAAGPCGVAPARDRRSRRGRDGACGQKAAVRQRRQGRRRPGRAAAATAQGQRRR